MSDISKIKINDTTYDIKDPGARTIADNAVNTANSAVAAANNANTNADNRVSKSGDTMTGLLKMNNQNIALNKPAADISTTIDNPQYCHIGATDKNDILFGYTQYIYYADGSSSAQLAARNKQTGATSTYDNSLILKCSKDGTRSVSLERAAWASPIGLTFNKLYEGNASSGTTCTLSSSQKFSDYLLLMFMTYGYANVQTATILSTAFARSTDNIVHAAADLDNNRSYNTSFKYVSDTQFKINTKGGSISKINVFGIIKLK